MTYLDVSNPREEDYLAIVRAKKLELEREFPYVADAVLVVYMSTPSMHCHCCACTVRYFLPVLISDLLYEILSLCSAPTQPSYDGDILARGSTSKEQVRYVL